MTIGKTLRGYVITDENIPGHVTILPIDRSIVEAVVPESGLMMISAYRDNDPNPQIEIIVTGRPGLAQAEIDITKEWQHFIPWPERDIIGLLESAGNAVLWEHVGGGYYP